LAYGAVGKLFHIDKNDSGEVIVVWLDFSDTPQIATKIKIK